MAERRKATTKKRKLSKVVGEQKQVSLGITGNEEDLVELVEEIRRRKGTAVVMWHKQ
jgi:hypothetical protein